MSLVQTKLLSATFEILSGGPAQTHVGTGGGAHHLICLGERRRMIVIRLHLDENGDNWSQMNKKTNFFQMGIADFRIFLRESANPFIILCLNIDNSILERS